MLSRALKILTTLSFVFGAATAVGLEKTDCGNLGTIVAPVAISTNICEHLTKLPSCTSVNGNPIVGFDKKGASKTPRRILVFGMIHGDEPEAGALSVHWLERLHRISPQNDWRIVPILNPDGLILKTRMNAHKIDLNRNFPTLDWRTDAQKFWKQTSHSDSRRFPGNDPGEPEVLCAISHIEEFKPELVISMHTPYGLLDFDGPRIAFPTFQSLPWKLLGNFPGSLGRYMWKERKVPVLTIELKADSLKKSADSFDRLQDLASDLIDLADSVPRRSATISE